VSESILLLPTKVRTLSGVLTVVAKRPISSTVPVTPPAVTKSPALKGRRIIRNTPAAKFASRPLQAVPTARPAPASSAAKLVVSTPKKPSSATTSTTFRVTATDEPRNPITVGSIGWRRSARCISETAR